MFDLQSSHWADRYFVQVSHGFPQVPSPMFRSTKFAIENRPGLENQSIEGVLHELSRLGAPDLSEIGLAGTAQQREDLVKCISDWHLVAFLGTTQLISQVCSVFQEVVRVKLSTYSEFPRTI